MVTKVKTSKIVPKSAQNHPSKKTKMVIFKYKQKKPEEDLKIKLCGKTISY